MFDAMGYAVATDRLWQAELNRRAARGMLAALFGPDQQLTDMFIRTTGYRQAELEEGFRSLDDHSRAIVSGYVDGINRCVREVRANRVRFCWVLTGSRSSTHNFLA